MFLTKFIQGLPVIGIVGVLPKMLSQNSSTNRVYLSESEI